MPLTRLKRTVFAGITVSATVALLLGGLLAVDLALHERAGRSAGLNVWGYRGPIARTKRPGEVRVAMLGGSTVFGYGVLWHEALPAQLERSLERQLPIGGAEAVSVVNLGMNNEGAYSFPFTLRDFEFLDYDVVLLYEGYNDLSGTNRSVFRHDSPVFRMVGYYPILPMILEEKRLALAYGDIATAYRAKNGDKVTFSPPPTHRAAAAALGVAEGMSAAVSAQLDRLIPVTAPEGRPARTSDTCPTPWQVYCASMVQAIDDSLAHGRRVLVVSQPYYNDVHRQQQDALRVTLARHFGGDGRVGYASLDGVVDLADDRVSFDGMHLTPGGNARVAQALTAAVAEVIRR